MTGKELKELTKKIKGKYRVEKIGKDNFTLIMEKRWINYYNGKIMCIIYS